MSSREPIPRSSTEDDDQDDLDDQGDEENQDDMDDRHDAEVRDDADYHDVEDAVRMCQ